MRRPDWRAKMKMLSLVPPTSNAADDQSDKSCRAGRHQVDHRNQDNPVNRLRQALGHLLGNIGHEQDEQTTQYCTGYGANPSDHQSDEQRKGGFEREAAGRPKLHSDPYVLSSDPLASRP